jgi:hypothetical protein
MLANEYIVLSAPFRFSNRTDETATFDVFFNQWQRSKSDSQPTDRSFELKVNMLELHVMKRPQLRSPSEDQPLRPEFRRRSWKSDLPCSGSPAAAGLRMAAGCRNDVPRRADCGCRLVGSPAATTFHYASRGQIRRKEPKRQRLRFTLHHRRVRYVDTDGLSSVHAVSLARPRRSWDGCWSGPRAMPITIEWPEIAKRVRGPDKNFYSSFL